MARGATTTQAPFTLWMAGGGIQGGIRYGSSDELGFKAVEHPTYRYDLHATAFHPLDIDHERLTYDHNGIERRLTNVYEHVDWGLAGVAARWNPQQT